MSGELHSVSSWRSFNGYQKIYKHKSAATNCEMTFGLYCPDAASNSDKRPCLLYLSGLTCTHANFMDKSGFQRLASKFGFYVIHPDTSPRGIELPGDSASWDFGKGAGFYLDATQEPWRTNYNMQAYVLELTKIVISNHNIDATKVGIFGHSMGGHGAISIGLKIFKSISAFAPICHPTECQWGKKAFSNYLGGDSQSWLEYDSALLAKKYSYCYFCILCSYTGPKRRILIDQGEEDQFLKEGQLQPESLEENEHLEVYTHMRAGYDHSYFFIATFIESHFDHHAKEFKET